MKAKCKQHVRAGDGNHRSELFMIESKGKDHQTRSLSYLTRTAWLSGEPPLIFVRENQIVWSLIHQEVGLKCSIAGCRKVEAFIINI